MCHQLADEFGGCGHDVKHTIKCPKMAQTANTCDPFASITIDKHDDAICFDCQDEVDVLCQFEQADEDFKAAVDPMAGPKLFFKEYIQWEKCGHRSHLRWTDIERDRGHQEYIIISELGQCFGCASVPAHQLKRMKLGPDPWGFNFDNIEGVPGSSSTPGAEQSGHPALSSSTSSAVMALTASTRAMRFVGRSEPPSFLPHAAELPSGQAHLNEGHTDDDDPEDLYNPSPQESEDGKSQDQDAEHADATESEGELSDDPDYPRYDTSRYKNKGRQGRSNEQSRERHHHRSHHRPQSEPESEPAPEQYPDSDDDSEKELASYEALTELIDAHNAPPELAIQDYDASGYTTLSQPAIPDWSSLPAVPTVSEDLSAEARAHAARMVVRAMASQSGDVKREEGGGNGGGSESGSGTKRPWYRFK